MTWLERNGHWVALALFVAIAYLLVGVLGVGALGILAGALGGASLGALLADAALVLGLTVLLVVAEIALAVAFVARVVRRLSFPTSERLARTFSVLETVLPPLRDLGLSRRFEPSLAEREARVKRRYVEGELSEPAFEREMADLLEESDSGTRPVERADPLDGVGSTVETADRDPDSRSADAFRSEKRREYE